MAYESFAKVYYSASEGVWDLIPNSLDVDEDWEYVIDVGSSTGGGGQALTILVTNTSDTDLTANKSKLPDVTYLGATNPEGDLAEGMKFPQDATL